MQLEVLSFVEPANDDPRARGSERSHHEHRAVRQHRLGRIDRGRSSECRGIGARRDQTPNRVDQGTRPRCDRRPQSLSLRSAAIWSRARGKRKRNSIGDEAAAFCVRGRPGSRSRRRQSIIRSSRSMAGISSTRFCSRNSTMSACARFPASSGSMSRSILDFATAEEISSLTGKELERAYLDDAERFASALFARCARRARSPICSARATSSRRRFFPTITRT